MFENVPKRKKMYLLHLKLYANWKNDVNQAFIVFFGKKSSKMQIN